MYKNRLEEIKEIHERANVAYKSYESSNACADQDTITDSLNTLFYEEHTDWLIEQAEKCESLVNELKEKIKVIDGRIERLSAPNQYHDQSKRIENLHGEALAFEKVLKMFNS
jgi:hypothetical protein